MGSKRKTKEELEDIYKAGVDIIQENNFIIRKKDFITEFQKRIGELSTSQLNNYLDTIVNRIKPNKPEFKFLTTKQLTLTDPLSAIMPLKDFERFISEIWIVSGDQAYRFFDPEENQFGRKSSYLNAVQEITAYFDSVSNDIGLLQIKIYFTSKAFRGIETVVCDFYEKLPGFSRPIDLVSTATCTHCSTIEFKKRALEQILEFTYRLFKNYWVKEKKKH